MATTSELSLKCKPHSYSMLLKTIGEQVIHGDDQTQKLEEFLARLEEERLKIDAFKRELPLCMQLLTNGMIILNILYDLHLGFYSYKGTLTYLTCKPMKHIFLIFFGH